MSLRRAVFTASLVCGLCVWAFARPADEPASAHGTDPAAREAEDDTGDNHDEAAARYRANQSRHWRQVAIGSSTSH